MNDFNNYAFDLFKILHRQKYFDFYADYLENGKEICVVFHREWYEYTLRLEALTRDIWDNDIRLAFVIGLEELSKVDIVHGKYDIEKIKSSLYWSNFENVDLRRDDKKIFVTCSIADITVKFTYSFKNILLEIKESNKKDIDPLYMVPLKNLKKECFTDEEFNRRYPRITKYRDEEHEYYAICTGKTKQKAIDKALKYFKVSLDNVDVEEIQREISYTGEKNKKAIVRVSLKQEEIQKRIDEKEEKECEEKRKGEELLKEIKLNIIDYCKVYNRGLYKTFINVHNYCEARSDIFHIKKEDLCDDILNIYKFMIEESDVSLRSICQKCYKYLTIKYRRYDFSRSDSDKILIRVFRIYRYILNNEPFNHPCEIDDSIESYYSSYSTDRVYEVILTYLEYLLVNCIGLRLFIFSMKIKNENKELGKIIENSRFDIDDDNICDEVYGIYTVYYKDTFDYTLSKTEFINVAQVYIDSFINSQYETMPLSDYNVYDLELPEFEFIEQNKIENIYSYITNNYLEKGKLDIILSCTDKKSYIQHIIENINWKILINKPLIQWLLECCNSIEFCERFNLYVRKNLLLNTENNKRYDIKLKEMFNDVQTGVDFENALSYMYKLMGYEVDKTSITGDQGADLVLTKCGIKSVVQAKYFTSNNVGNAAVQEVVGALRYYGATKGIVITNSKFTNSAIELAKVNDIKMIDGEGLEILINSII